MTPQLISDLKRDEGLKLTAYQDTLGIWTVGYGHAHVPKGTVWTQVQAEQQLLIDIQHAEQSLQLHLPWLSTLSDRRQDALVNMAFNMGVQDLLTFNTFLSLVKQSKYDDAATDLTGTKWYGQVGDRAKRIQQLIRNGG